MASPKNWSKEQNTQDVESWSTENQKGSEVGIIEIRKREFASGKTIYIPEAMILGENGQVTHELPLDRQFSNRDEARKFVMATMRTTYTNFAEMKRDAMKI